MNEVEILRVDIMENYSLYLKKKNLKIRFDSSIYN